MSCIPLRHRTRKRPRRNTTMMSRWFSRGSATTQPPQLPQSQLPSEKVTRAKQSKGEGNTDGTSIMSIDTLAQAYDEPDINLHLLPSGDGAIISIVPPTQPHPGVIASGHVPVDIVLVIDISGSMEDAAQPPKSASGTNGTVEDFGLSVLDLTKHAALTIMETLNEEDRLSIVTYSARANVLQPLTHMTTEAKASTKQAIAGIRPQSTTNMWQGIMYGLDQFNGNTTDCGRVPAIMVLTDGMPNFGDPSKGYVAKLRDMAPLPATIHTFGFGYHLDACLLKAVAEVGSGNFSFIPDSGMIGTVFVHAVAHLQTTHATKCILEVKTPISLKMVTVHESIINGTIQEKDTAYSTGQHNILRLDLGNLQYGQSRDIYLECRSRTGDKWTFKQAVAAGKKLDSSFDSSKAVLSASLGYSFMRSNVHTVSRERSLVQSPDAHESGSLSPAMVAYHKSRALLCHFLMSFFRLHPHAGYVLEPLDQDQQPSNLDEHSRRLKKLISDIPASHLLNDAPSSSQPILTDDERSLLSSLLLDLEGEITLAVSNTKNFSKWAMPYFASLSHAHIRQICKSFKDYGPLKYNDNPFFRECRDTLDRAFDGIEPPVPSRLPGQPLNLHHPGGGGLNTNGFPPAYSTTSNWSDPTSPPPSYTVNRPAINMSLYNDCNAGCFAAETLVHLAPPDQSDAQKDLAKVPISTIRAGSRVLTPLGSRQVRYVLRTAVRDAPLCQVRLGIDAGGKGVLATPWHPVCIIPESPSPPIANGMNAGAESCEHALSLTKWTFPAYLTASQDDAATDKAEGAEAYAGTIRYTGWVYTLMLEPDSDPSAHAILLSSDRSTTSTDRQHQQIWGVTLGHGLTTPAVPCTASSVRDAGPKSETATDVRAHSFFGSYTAVENVLLDLLNKSEYGSDMARPACDSGGLVSCSGMRRDAATGLVTGFMPL